MPAGWDEFTVTELAGVLAEPRGAAGDMLDLACHLEVKLPGTKAAFRDGILRESKVEIIARATVRPGHCGAGPRRGPRCRGDGAGRAGRLTPGGLRAAIVRAVMEVAPQKARKTSQELECQAATED